MKVCINNNILLGGNEVWLQKRRSWGKKTKGAIAILATTLLISSSYLGAAGFTRRTFDVPANTIVKSATYYRSGDHPYVEGEVHSVFPHSGPDTFKYLQLGNEHAGVMRGYVQAEEGSGPRKLYVTQNKLTERAVRLLMKGNDPNLA